MSQAKSRSALRLSSQDDLSQDLAGTYRQESTAYAGDQQVLAQDLSAIDASGYVLLPSLVDEACVQHCRAALEPLLGPLGRNEFEGLQTQRAYALLRKTRALDALVAHPRVLSIVNALLGIGPLLSACLAIRIHPGESAQLPHYDAGFYPQARPRACLAVSVVWALDNFTADNGATMIWPGSHRWPQGRKPVATDRCLPALMPAGSALVFHGDLWHGGGANHSSRSRLGLTPQYCAQWLRTMENMALAVPPEVVGGLAPPLQALLGYQIRPPFMGHVDGLHPKRLLADRLTG